MDQTESPAQPSAVAVPQTDLCLCIFVPDDPARVAALPWTLAWYARWAPKVIQVWRDNRVPQLDAWATESGCDPSRMHLCVSAVRGEEFDEALTFAHATVYDYDPSARWAAVVRSGELLIPSEPAIAPSELLNRYARASVLIPDVTGYLSARSGTTPEWDTLGPPERQRTLDRMMGDGWRYEPADRPCVWDRTRVGAVAYDDGPERRQLFACSGMTRRYPQPVRPALRLVDIITAFDSTRGGERRYSESMRLV